MKNAGNPTGAFEAAAANAGRLADRLLIRTLQHSKRVWSAADQNLGNKRSWIAQFRDTMTNAARGTTQP